MKEKRYSKTLPWIFSPISSVAEDINPYLPSFGDSTITTPNLSWLASEGVCYDNVFASTPVCAPARAAFFLGL